MIPPRLYIMQTTFDGTEYTKGSVLDTFEEYNVICSDMPFVLFPEAKETVTLDWVGEDGVEAYIPHRLRVKDYDLEATFLYVGDHDNMRQDVDRFIKYLQGRISDVDENPAGARLAISEEYTQTGRKDVVFVNAAYPEWWNSREQDDEALAVFKVKFHVYDPMTDVVPIYSGSKVVGLTWT